MGLLMQTTMLVVQNSVAMRDVGAASGAATMFRTVGGSLGVSLLGTLFTQRLTTTLSSTVGAAGAGSLPVGQLTPTAVAGLPAALREAYQLAVASGVSVVFFWAGLIALLAVVAALVIKEVPMRGSAPVPVRR